MSFPAISWYFQEIATVAFVFLVPMGPRIETQTGSLSLYILAIAFVRGKSLRANQAPKGHLVDALASRGDEGRSTLR